MPYVKAWAEEYGAPGLTVVGAHSPEFPFEHDPENIRSALAAMGIGYPVAVDNDFAIWRAFDNAYWPALYVVDAQGRVRYHHFGEEAYERSERAIRQLLAEAGHDVDPELVHVEADGVYLAADWPRWARRRPTSATHGPPGSPRRAGSPSTAAGSTPSRSGSG